MESLVGKPFIVVSDGFDKELFNTLKNVKEFELYPESKITQEKLQELLPKINGLVIRSATKVTSELLESAPNLKYVIRAGEGTDNINKAYCALKGISVSNTPGANANSAAEHTIALMFTLLRKTAWADSSMHSGRWDKAQFTGRELWKKKIGFIGFGGIGQIVAKRLSGFEIEATYYTRNKKDHGLSYASWTDDIDKIFRENDIVTVHLPKTRETLDLIGEQQFNLMKKDALFINCARGGIVNEEDLYKVLSGNKIKAAALDVFSSEPLEPESKLLKLKNLITTPHLGASTSEAQFRVSEMCVEQLKEFFINENLLNQVN